MSRGVGWRRRVITRRSWLATFAYVIGALTPADPTRSRPDVHTAGAGTLGGGHAGQSVGVELTDKRLRRGTFTSVAELVEAIELWVEYWNDDPKPFIWHRTADEIIAKVQRGRATLIHHTKSATDH